MLAREQSHALLTQVSNGRITATEADELADLVGDLPLGLSVLGSQMADEFTTWEALKAEFQRNLLADFPDEFNQLIYASLKTSIDALGDKKERYLELAIFPNEVRLEPKVVTRYWSQTAGLSEFAGQRLFSSLVKKSLIQKDSTLHDLPYAYLHYITTEDERIHWHNALIATYGTADTWGALPDDDGRYGWRYLASHLQAAGRVEDLRSLLTDGSYLQEKIRRLGVEAVRADLALLPEDETFGRLIGATGRLGGSGRAPEELWNQVQGRVGMGSALHASRERSQPRFELRFASLIPADEALVRVLEGHTASV